MSLSDSRTKWLWSLGVLVVAILAALLYSTAVSETRIDGPLRGDARDYFAYAYNIDAHGVYSRAEPNAAQKPASDALRSPGYPAFLSMLLDTGDVERSLRHVLAVQAFFGIVTVIVYLFVFRGFLGMAWALAAGVVTAISPHLVNASVYFLTETLFTFLLGLHLLALGYAWRRKHGGWALLAGALLALSIMVRPTTQFLALAYVLGLLAWFGFQKGWHWRLLLWVIAPVVVATAAWSARNVVETGHPSDPIMSANFVQHGMYINMMYRDRPETFGYPYRFDPDSGAMTGNVGVVLGKVKQYFMENPRRYLAWILIGKPIQFFSWNLTESVGDAFIYAPLYSPYFDRPLFQATHEVAQITHPFLMLLGLAGAVLAVRRGRENWMAGVLGLVTIYFVALHIVGAPFPRYSIPLRPISYGMAFFALQAGYDWLRVRVKGSSK